MDTPETNDFLKLLYHAIPYGWLELTLLKAGAYPQVYWLELPNVLNQAQLEYLQEQNEDGWNIYYGVTVRSVKQDKGRGRRADALFTRVLWVDMDEKSEEALTRLKAAKPSLIIDSGGGYHGYWLLNHVMVLNGNEAPLDRFGGVMLPADDELFKRTLKGLALHLQADVKVAEYARIMRLIGFKNMKPERGGATCHVIEDRLYTYDFAALANEYAYLVKENIRTQRPVNTVTPDHLPPFIVRYLENGASVGERNSTFNKMCYAYNSMGKTQQDAETDLAPRARADGLSDHEITMTLNSAFKHAAPPMDARIAARDRGMVSE